MQKESALLFLLWQVYILLYLPVVVIATCFYTAEQVLLLLWS